MVALPSCYRYACSHCVAIIESASLYSILRFFSLSLVVFISYPLWYNSKAVVFVAVVVVVAKSFRSYVRSEEKTNMKAELVAKIENKYNASIYVSFVKEVWAKLDKLDENAQIAKVTFVFASNTFVFAWIHVACSVVYTVSTVKHYYLNVKQLQGYAEPKPSIVRRIFRYFKMHIFRYFKMPFHELRSECH